jgi:hypothetical protein
MSTVRCTRTPGVACVRRAGHAGACTACPSAATLDWDTEARTIEQRINVAVTLLALDFPAPSWADLNDPL